MLADHFVLIVRGQLDISPTPLNVLQLLKESISQVSAICSNCTSSTLEKLSDQGIRVHCLKNFRSEFTNRHDNSLFNKLFDYLSFRRLAWKCIRENRLQNACFWIARIDTARAMGNKLRSLRYYLGLHELHDTYPAYQRTIAKYCHQAVKVVVPEYNRAHILAVWHGLKQIPSVLPNKPLGVNLKRGMPISDEQARSIFNEQIKGKKIVLYQGALSRDRNLLPLAEAVNTLSDEYCFVVMGKDTHNQIAELKGACGKIIHIPWVRPPAHLEITSHAHIGIAAYDHDCLNSIYCAPNKIWEYSGFGIPMLCQDIPGLRYTVEYADAGRCVNLFDSHSIARGLEELCGQHVSFSSKATLFYDSVNVHEIMNTLLQEDT